LDSKGFDLLSNPNESNPIIISDQCLR